MYYKRISGDFSDHLNAAQPFSLGRPPTVDIISEASPGFSEFV
jgi:hypothetical protein